MSVPMPNFSRFISRDQSAMYIYLCLGGLFLLIGVGLVVAGFVFQPETSSANLDLVFKLAGIFVTLITGIPVKSFIARRDRISGLRSIEERWQELTKAQNVPQSELDRLNELTWKLYEQGGLSAA